MVERKGRGGAEKGEDGGSSFFVCSNSGIVEQSVSRHRERRKEGRIIGYYR